MASVYVMIGIILLIFRYDFFNIFNLRYDVSFILGLISITISLFLFLYLYLQGNIRFGAQINKRYLDDEFRYRNETKYESNYLIDELRYKIDKLESKISNYTFQKTSISDEEKNSIINDIKTSIKDILNEDLLREIERIYSDKIIGSQKIGLILDDFNRISKRISNEIYALGRRANINLLIGSFTTVMAVGVLIYWVFSNNNQFDNLTKLLSNYIPRLSIIIFIELFAYFFLKLYKSNLQEIKYFQNELTNIESKFTSLRSAITFNLDTTKDYVIRSFSDTERNIFKKDKMTTEDLEKVRLETNKLNKLVETINNSIKNIRN
jgi:hypothetical protein